MPQQAPLLRSIHAIGAAIDRGTVTDLTALMDCLRNELETGVNPTPEVQAELNRLVDTAYHRVQSITHRTVSRAQFESKEYYNAQTALFTSFNNWRRRQASENKP